MLFSKARNSLFAYVAIALFAVVGFFVLIGLKRGQRVFVDCAEAFAWGQKFLGGYGRHPPLTGWIAGTWYSVFPSDNLSSFALSRVMCAICLIGLYLVAKRVIGEQRALFVTLVIFVYPLFLGFKSDRFNNYAVLQAIVPFAVLAFLVAWEKRTILSGALLGLTGALACMTIYSGSVVVAAIGIAALIHRDRFKFLSSPAPYVAIAIFILVLSPHLLWLFRNDFASVRFVGRYLGENETLSLTQKYIVYHLTIILIPIGAAVAALWPITFVRVVETPPNDERSLLTTIVAVLVIGPLAVFLTLGTYVSGEWGNPFFTLLPVVILAYFPTVSLRSGVRKATYICAATVAVYAVLAAVYPTINFKARPDYGPFQPTRELSAEVTRLWREKTNTPLAVVVSDLEHSTHVAFYSADHPKPVPDFSLQQSPWLNPAELRSGYVMICDQADTFCADQVNFFDPSTAKTKPVAVTATRQFDGMTSSPLTWSVWLMTPR